MIKPLFLVDLDDNLFQTKRKMSSNNNYPFRNAALDREGKPRSFMSEEQANFVDWLLQHSDLVPVTARSTEETKRVTIAFNSWKITTHGAVIITPDGQIDDTWKKHILLNLQPYQLRIKKYHDVITEKFASLGIAAWGRIAYEYNGIAIYLVAKHTDSSKTHELYEIAEQVNASIGLDDFYIHHNDNNISWVPKCIDKGSAARYLIEKIRDCSPHTPIIGLGDSVSDFSFLKYCSWFGMPKQSQIRKRLESQILNTKE